MFKERITDLSDRTKCDVESRAPVSPRFQKIDLRKIDDIKYLNNKPMYLIHAGERQSLPRQIIEVIGCESGYCIVLDDTLKIVGAAMNALNHGYYSCIVLRGDKISLIHAPCMRVDKVEVLKPEMAEELEWDRDQL
jgi:hypothetical protein